MTSDYNNSINLQVVMMKSSNNKVNHKLNNEIKNLSRAKLLVLCERLNLKGFQNLRKQELIKLLLENEAHLKPLINKSWWNKYHNHVYGFSGFIALVFTVYSIYKLPVGYEDSNRPYLEPELVIYKIDSTGIQYKYILKNTGVLPAKDLIFSFRSENGLRGGFESDQRVLAPKGVMEIKNPLIINLTTIDLKKLNKLVLVASYKTDIGGSTKNYYSFFNFNIPINEFRVGSYIYNDVKRVEGRFTQDKFKEYLDIEFPKIKNKRKILPNEFINSQSYVILMKMEDSITSRDKYIFDAGETHKKDRISLFLDSQNNLTFRIIDSNGHMDSLVVKNQLELFNKINLIISEYGYGVDFTVLRLYRNNTLMAEKRISKKLVLNNAKDMASQFFLGGDLYGNNGGIFIMNNFLIFSKFLNESSRRTIIEEFKGKQERWLKFNGEQSISTKGNNN